MTRLVVSDLAVRFPAAAKGAAAATPVRAVSFDVSPGEMVGLVGESGCGKSLTALACLGLLPGNARASGSILLGDQQLVGRAEADWRGLRGRRIALIFQNPMTAMNPFFRVGTQIEAVVRTHFPLTRAEARARTADALARVQLPADAAARYPHQMSGGQLQRAMIAMAVACEPAFVVADEPTTALDVTVQARIMRLLRGIADQGMGLLLISHDLELVAQSCDRLAVMYAGRVMEHGPARQVFHAPSHPYAAALLRTQPRRAGTDARLEVIDGRVPPADAAIPGCVFANRCDRATARCENELPAMTPRGAHAGLACHHPVSAQPEEARHG